MNEKAAEVGTGRRQTHAPQEAARQRGLSCGAGALAERVRGGLGSALCRHDARLCQPQVGAGSVRTGAKWKPCPCGLGAAGGCEGSQVAPKLPSHHPSPTLAVTWAISEGCGRVRVGSVGGRAPS